MERAESVCLTQPSAPALDGFSIAGFFFFFFFFLLSAMRCNEWIGLELEI